MPTWKRLMIVKWLTLYPPARFSSDTFNSAKDCSNNNSPFCAATIVPKLYSVRARALR